MHGRKQLAESGKVNEMRNHAKTDLYRAEREKGKTYKEIAEQFGVTTQTVAMVCCKSDELRFRRWTKERCIYPNVRNWLNDNKVSLNEFIRRTGAVSSSGNTGRYSSYFNGKNYPTKGTIDKMLAVTGLTYEKFWEVDNG